jgi:hypothetical protein
MTPQQMTALAKANEYRAVRSALREWVREPTDPVDTRDRLASILDGPPAPELGKNLTLDEFLGWAVRMYANRRRAIAILAGCTPHRAVLQLTERQREAVALGLRMSACDVANVREGDTPDVWRDAA